MKDETQFARKIADVLEVGSRKLDDETAARLTAARIKAVSAMAQPAHMTSSRSLVVGWQHVVEFSHSGGYRFWLPVCLLVAGIFAVVSSTLITNGNQPIDTDALLLASDLPPEAYADKEFVAWLEHSSQL